MSGWTILGFIVAEAVILYIASKLLKEEMEDYKLCKVKNSILNSKLEIAESQVKEERARTNQLRTLVESQRKEIIRLKGGK